MGSVKAQHDSIPESDPAILQRIGEWQDLKFGFMMHWGIYAQWGIVESWNICNEPWINRGGANYEDYKRAYWALNKTFNPKHFTPKSWAAAAKGAGMKYVVFTTKHHDGFCMFDSKYTDYTSLHSPAKTDFTRGVVDAFRGQGFWTGLYFSKPDWHCDDYWAHEWATPDRNVNYSIADHPDRWKKYQEFTYNQIHELTHNYGPIDILWLDGGWVRPSWSMTNEARSWLGCHGYVQDVNVPRIAKMAREHTPDLLIVDRGVGGRYENYTTYEQRVPDSYNPEPWECCMSMGDSWSYLPQDNYKSTNTLIHTLCDVVAKGGNLLLNVGPDSYGVLPDTAVLRLKEIGQWMKLNSEAIYATRPAFPFVDGQWRFTQTKDAKTVYAIYLVPEGQAMPEVVTLPKLDREPLKVEMLAKGGSVKMRREGDQTQLYVHPNEASKHAVVIKVIFEKGKKGRP
jgi:alpha-L-fucosidase